VKHSFSLYSHTQFSIFNICSPRELLFSFFFFNTMKRTRSYMESSTHWSAQFVTQYMRSPCKPLSLDHSFAIPARSLLPPIYEHPEAPVILCHLLSRDFYSRQKILLETCCVQMTNFSLKALTVNSRLLEHLKIHENDTISAKD